MAVNINITIPLKPTPGEFQELLDFVKLLGVELKHINISELLAAQQDTTGGESESDSTPNLNPPQVDSAGFPWNEEIHSGAKTLKKDGTWTYRKGADKTRIAAVEAGYRAAASAMPAPTASALPLPAAPTTTGLPLPIPTPAAAKTPYEELVDFIGRNPLLTPEYVNATLAAGGITGGLPSLAANNDYCKALQEQLKGVLIAAGQPVA